MLDGTSFRFILGFLAILAISFAIFLAIGYYRDKEETKGNDAQVQVNL